MEGGFIDMLCATQSRDFVDKVRRPLGASGRDSELPYWIDSVNPPDCFKKAAGCICVGNEPANHRIRVAASE
jgi:hypothetical protein